MKDHIREHAFVYITATGVVVAGITVLVMRRSTTAQRGVGEEFNAQRGLFNTASFTFKSPQTISITTVLDRENKGHPGWPVRNLESNRIFFSQREAAIAFDISEGMLSGHIKGKYPDVSGLHFERINLAPTA